MHDFIEYSLVIHALEISKEPKWTLKSGRKSPYYFNSGRFSTGASLGGLGLAYAEVLHAFDQGIDVLFGPAYKGIPLAVATALKAHDHFDMEFDVACNRKEAKDHGDGGMLVGASLDGKRVVIIDDVITSGGAKREAIDLIRAEGGVPVAIVIAFDREERGQGELSAAQEMEAEFKIPVFAAATVTGLVHYLEKMGGYAGELAAIHAYQEKWGVK